MTRTPVLSRPLARASVLLAALLHLLGAAAGPVLHAPAAARSPAVVDAVSAPSSQGPAEATFHDERHCLVCQTGAHAALPQAVSRLPRSLAGRAVAPVPAQAPAQAQPARSPLARGPPRLS